MTEDLIRDIAARYTTLSQHGAEWWGCCPFHTENTPSFSVNPEKNVFHCFGCGKSGDAITLLRDLDGLTFPEAAARVGKDLGPQDRTVRRRTRQLQQAFVRWREQQWMLAYQSLRGARARLVQAQEVQHFYRLAPSTFTAMEKIQAAQELMQATTALLEAQEAFVFLRPDADPVPAQKLWKAGFEGEIHVNRHDPPPPRATDAA